MMKVIGILEVDKSLQNIMLKLGIQNNSRLCRMNESGPIVDDLGFPGLDIHPGHPGPEI